MKTTRAPGFGPRQSRAPVVFSGACVALGVGLVLAVLVGGASSERIYGHGTVDQEFTGTFTAASLLSTPSSLAQGFTPGQTTLVALDVFLSTDGQTVATPITVSVNVREQTFGGAWGTILGTASAIVPAGSSGIPSAPYLLHIDLASTVTVAAGTPYVIQIEPIEGVFWANRSGAYSGGTAYVGTTSIPSIDFGFRTYYAPAPPSDSTPPEIAYDLNPDLPANGWYGTDVTLDWTVTDAESSAVPTGCEDATVNADQDLTTYSCSASSAGGAAGPVTVQFGRDTVAPAIVAAITAGTLSNGWYRSDVTVGFTCADDRSGIAVGACPAGQTLSAEGAAVSSAAATVTDRAGNESAPSEMITVSIDKTPPSVTITPDRDPDQGDDAYDHEVTFTATGNDGSGSGSVACDAPEAYSGPLSDAASVEMSCTDLAGNVGSATYAFAFVEPADTTKPTITAVISSGTAGAGGWYVSAVVVHFTCSDDGSGIPAGNCPADETLSTEGTSVSSTARTVFDAAGNESDPSNVVTVSIDLTPPSAGAAASPASNPAGWNSTAVTVTFSASDAVSGVGGCDPPVTLSEDGSGQSATGSCSDVAGNTQSASAININIDRTMPGVTITPSRPPDSGGAYDHPVTFTASGSDGGSGVAYCDAPETYSGPLSSTASVEMACADNAGNIGTASVAFEYVDGTPPVVSFVLSPSLPAGGWYRSDVTLTWTVTEAESPDTLTVTGCADQVVTSDRAYAKYSCAASSAGGAASVVEVEFGRDATKPVLAAALDGTAGAGGWFTSDVTVRFTCTDAGSGIAVDTVPDAVLATEAANQSVSSSGACTDVAGNAADSLTVNDIDIDKSGPTATLDVVSGTVGLDGWYTSNVLVRTAGSDAVSGPVSCTADQTLSSDTTAHAFAGSCTNAAGLPTAASGLTVRLDKTPPVLAPALSASSVKKDVSLTASANAVDATSGVATSSCGSIDTSVVGSHTVTCSAKDRAGNSASATMTYEVLSVVGVIVYGFPPPPGGGYGTFSFGGGTFDQLLTASGCPRGTAVFFFNKRDGGFAVWIPGTEVGVVNEEFMALFAGAPPLPDGSIFTARCL